MKLKLRLIIAVDSAACADEASGCVVWAGLLEAFELFGLGPCADDVEGENYDNADHDDTDEGDNDGNVGDGCDADCDDDKYEDDYAHAYNTTRRTPNK